MLRSIAVQEADRLVTLLTPGMGKLRATVRGARRITSRLGGHMDTFNRVSLTLAQGRTFDVVIGAESLESFGSLKDGLDRVAAGLYLAELADRLVPEGAPHPNTYGLLLATFRTLNEHGLNPVVPRYAELRLLDDAGFMPELHDCVVCGTAVTPDHHLYAPAMGGVACESCVPTRGQVFPLSVNALKVLRFFARSGFAEALRLRLEQPLSDEVEVLMTASVHDVVERDVASSGFVDHLRRRGNRPLS